VLLLKNGIKRDSIFLVLYSQTFFQSLAFGMPRNARKINLPLQMARASAAKEPTMPQILLSQHDLDENRKSYRSNTVHNPNPNAGNNNNNTAITTASTSKLMTSSNDIEKPITNENDHQTTKNGSTLSNISLNPTQAETKNEQQNNPDSLLVNGSAEQAKEEVEALNEVGEPEDVEQSNETVELPNEDDEVENESPELVNDAEVANENPELANENAEVANENAELAPDKHQDNTNAIHRGAIDTTINLRDHNLLKPTEEDISSPRGSLNVPLMRSPSYGEIANRILNIKKSEASGLTRATSLSNLGPVIC
jgi:hypothetical protein